MAKRRRDPEAGEFWRLAIELQRESGLSVRQFCRHEQLQESAFYMWRRKLREPTTCTGGAEVGAESTRRAQHALGSTRKTPSNREVQDTASQSAVHPMAAAFVPVHVWNGPIAVREERIEIVLGGGRQLVRIPNAFDRQTLCDVLSVLERSAC